MNDPDPALRNSISTSAASGTENGAAGYSDPDATAATPEISPPSQAESAIAGSLTIGNYRLLRKLGEGGMGQVWLAEQNAPIQRQVALKLIKVGRYDDAVLQRFYAERQSLAIMDHPAIAKVFDAGATPDGQPYFVMEYVPGDPITDYCDRRRLAVRERLELLMKVCEGVQHAHQKAVMHRDLKPANILVVEVDGQPVPRIIDFGLAKTATPQLDGETQLTMVGGVMGTPGFMSPEQADSRVMDIDTRTDVYSLGAVLYVLLTGRLPFESVRSGKLSFPEFLRQVCEEDPPRPSTKISSDKGSSKTAAEARATEPEQLAKLLHGDLDWIVMKALERDRARRYGTPMELAADIGHYLANEPIVARPTSTAYRVRKYVRRHRVSVSAAAALVLLLAGFGVMQAVQVRRITQQRDRADQERDRANRERDRANRITDFMTRMFQVSNPSESRGNTITAREILDKASSDIETGMVKDPEAQAQMMMVMGSVYKNLALIRSAQPLMEHAFEVRRRLYGPEDKQTVESMNELASVLEDAGRYPEAEKLFRQIVDILRRRDGPDQPTALGNVASVLNQEGRYAEAEKADREALDGARHKFGPNNPVTIAWMGNLSQIISWEGHQAEAEQLVREAGDTARRAFGPENGQALGATGNLVLVLSREGRYAEAEKLCRTTLDTARHAFGPKSPSAIVAMFDLGVVLPGEGHYAEAEKLDRETFDLARHTFGPETPGTLWTMVNLGLALSREGRYAEAEKLDREGLEIARRTLGPNIATAAFLYNLGCNAARSGNRTRALSLLGQALDNKLLPYQALAIENDPDLKSLHGAPRFGALVAHAKEVVRVETTPAAKNAN